MSCQTDHIGLSVNIASHLIRRRMDSFSTRYGLTGIQSHILSYLVYQGEQEREVFQRDIERRFAIRRSSVTSVITNLEQNGFLTRQPVQGDARLKKLVITEKGRDATRQLSDAILGFEASLNSCFTEEEQTELLRLLGKIIRELDDSPCRQSVF